MRRMVSFALQFFFSIAVAVAQPGALQDGPLISLFLPQGFPSEKVQLQYFLTGPFGGYGSFIRPEPHRQTLDFTPSVNGMLADRVRIIAYLPGCELVVLDFPLAGTAAWRKLDCRPPSTIMLHGRIPPAYVGRTINIRVAYRADWAFDFFGIRDGIAVVFQLATSVPNGNGEFTTALPDFYKENLGRASYVLGFNCTDCNDAGSANANHSPLELPVAASYPPLIEFNPDPPN